MADKAFGVNELIVHGIGVGTTTISSPDNLDVDADNVGITSNITIDGITKIKGLIGLGSNAIDYGTAGQILTSKGPGDTPEWKSTGSFGGILTIGVRTGSAVELVVTGSSFTVLNRSGGNTTINI